MKYGAFDFFIKGVDEMKDVESILANLHQLNRGFNNEKRQQLYIKSASPAYC
jgi:hypothetical protein